MQRLNKKGQEGFSTTGLLAVVLGLIALVVIAMFIYNMYSKPGQLAKLLPDQFQQAVSYCQNSPFKSQASQYCTDYKEFTVKSGLSSSVYYYNCYDLFKQAGDDTGMKAVTCTGDQDQAQNYCISLLGTNKLESGKAAYVSGISCEYTAGAVITGKDSEGTETRTVTQPELKFNSNPIESETLFSRYPSLELK